MTDPDFRAIPTLHRRHLIQKFAGLAAAGAAVRSTKSTIAQNVATQLNILMASSSIPGVNDFTLQLGQSWAEQRGVGINIALTDLVDLPARADRVVRGGELRDVVELQDLQPFLHSDNLVDLTLLANAVIAEQGSYLPWVEQTVRVYGSWFSVPIGGSTPAMIYRPSALNAAGFTAPPANWNAYFDFGEALKSVGAPAAGQALAQTPFASTAFCYSYMWSNGASEIGPNSREVVFKSNEMATALEAFAQGWQLGIDPAGSNWDDKANLSAFVNGQTSMTIAGADVYLASLASGNTDVAVARIPYGTAGQYVPVGSRSLGIPLRSGNADLAADFIGWWSAQAQYSQWIVAQQGAMLSATQPLSALPVFDLDPNLRPFVDAQGFGRIKGYSAAPSKVSAEVAANYFVVNTFADVARGVDVPTALDRGSQLMQMFYTESQPFG